jgi:multidrug efflux pump subunit AcrB
MGVLTLVGIAVNNAIVLLDYANRAAREGLGWAEDTEFGVHTAFAPRLAHS